MYVTARSLADRQRPGFFEMLMQERTVPLLRPATEYVSQVLATYYPSYLSWLHRYHDELFYGCFACIESHYLRFFDGSASENYYGLKRMTFENGRFTSMHRHQKVLSFVMLILAPYLAVKVEKYARERQREENGPKWVRWIPFIQSMIHSIFFVYMVLYLYDRTRYYSPIYHLLGLSARRLEMTDLMSHQQLMRRNRGFAFRHMVSFHPMSLVYVLRYILYFCLDYALYLLPLASFLFRTLSNFQQPNTTISGDIPKPPCPPSTQKASAALEHPSECPLCRQPFGECCFCSEWFCILLQLYPPSCGSAWKLPNNRDNHYKQ